MNPLWVRRTLSLTSFAILTVCVSSHAEEPTVEMVRFRPFSFLNQKNSDEKEKGKDDAKNSLQEPLAAPPTSTRGNNSSTPGRSNDDKSDPLLLLVNRAIEKTGHRYLDANQHRPWQITHGLLAMRRDFMLRDGNRTVNAIDWISNGGTFRGEYWFEATEHGGRAHPYNGVPYEFEGHVNQTLALLAHSNLPLTHEFTVARGRKVTMADMVRHAQMTVSTKEEITWTLWFLTHYLDIDTEWTNAAGEPWSLEELVRLQTKGKVIGAPCGGTHGLFAIAYARNAYLYKHGELRGVWFEADQKVKQHIELARSLQNPDGSFSTEMFKGPGHSRDFNERIKASGHMLEWLMMAVPHSRLNEAWIRKSVASIATDLVHNAARPAECGPLYHALNSLILYRDRVAPVRRQVPETIVESAPAASPLPALAVPDAAAKTAPIIVDSHAGESAAATAVPSGEVTAPPAAVSGNDSVLEGPSLEPVRIAIEPNEARPIN
ncbi:MAG: hypothetical protein KF861_00620 [Planctomycetaceae bacterium]|nr:hypothetical protein [Planctomycetaceae bacterium]